MSDEDTSTIWHYTSLDTLSRILDNRYLLATEVGFQNDPLEDITARQAFRDSLESLKKRPQHARFAKLASQAWDDLSYGERFEFNAERLLSRSRFLLCGSSDGDNMYAWRTYGSASSIGCAISLDASSPLGIVAESPASKIVPWSKVSYDAAGLRTQIRSDLVDLEKEAGLEDLDIVTSGVEKIEAEARAVAKHPSYEDEKEWRITVEAPPRSAVQFSPGSFGPRPQVRLASVTSWGEIASSANRAKLPIREVRLGPGAPKEAESSVEWLLAMHEYLIDGAFEVIEFEDEFGNTDYAEHVDETDRVRVTRSTHSYRRI